MEGRPNRSRGGNWKRGGRGGYDNDSSGGEHRGRGRGGHHRGRGKRDHYRGRGRGGGAHAAEFHHRVRPMGETAWESRSIGYPASPNRIEKNCTFVVGLLWRRTQFLNDDVKLNRTPFFTRPYYFTNT